MFSETLQRSMFGLRIHELLSVKLRDSGTLLSHKQTLTNDFRHFYGVASTHPLTICKHISFWKELWKEVSSLALPIFALPPLGISSGPSSPSTCFHVTLGLFLRAPSVLFPQLESASEQGPRVSLVLYYQTQSQSLEPLS